MVGLENQDHQLHLGNHPALKDVMAWALDQAGTITEDDLNNSFGDLADEEDRVENLKELDVQVHSVLTQLAEKEPFDIVNNSGQGRGFEAWRRLLKRYEPATAGRSKALLKAVQNPPRAKLEELSAAIEHWEEQVTRYERTKDKHGTRHRFAEKVKNETFAGMCPFELENHFQMNHHRLDT